MHLGALGIMGETATRHRILPMIRVWLPRQSAAEKHNQGGKKAHIPLRTS